MESQEGQQKRILDVDKSDAKLLLQGVQNIVDIAWSILLMLLKWIKDSSFAHSLQ